MEQLIECGIKPRRSPTQQRADSLHKSMKAGDSILLEPVSSKERIALSLALGRASGTTGATHGMYKFQSEGTGFRLFKTRDQ